MSKNTSFYLSSLILLLLFVLLLNPRVIILQIHKLAKPRLIRTNSDVPVTYGIGWQHYSPIKIDDFKIEILHAPLNLLNSEAVVRFYISGTLNSIHDNWIPYIDKVNISDRLVRNDAKNSIGDILITPLVTYEPAKKTLLETKTSNNFHKSKYKFNIKVDKKISTYKWDCNQYIVHLEDKEYKFELFHDKSCSDIGTPGCGASCPK